MFKELHQRLVAAPNASMLADAICEAIDSVVHIAPINGGISGSNGVKIRAGVAKNGYGWLEVSGNTIHALCEKWYSDKSVETEFCESVRKHLDNQEQSVSIQGVEIDPSSWIVKITISYDGLK
jgi:hypothetical protein